MKPHQRPRFQPPPGQCGPASRTRRRAMRGPERRFQPLPGKRPAQHALLPVGHKEIIGMLQGATTATAIMRARGGHPPGRGPHDARLPDTSALRVTLDHFTGQGASNDGIPRHTLAAQIEPLYRDHPRSPAVTPAQSNARAGEKA